MLPMAKSRAFALFNQGLAVYHDDIGDYASNEPTMDGTAGLIAYAASLEARGRAWRAAHPVKGTGK